MAKVESVKGRLITTQIWSVNASGTSQNKTLRDKPLESRGHKGEGMVILTVNRMWLQNNGPMGMACDVRSNRGRLGFVAM